MLQPLSRAEDYQDNHLAVEEDIHLEMEDNRLVEEDNLLVVEDNQVVVEEDIQDSLVGMVVLDASVVEDNLEPEEDVETVVVEMVVVAVQHRQFE